MKKKWLAAGALLTVGLGVGVLLMSGVLHAEDGGRGGPPPGGPGGPGAREMPPGPGGPMGRGPGMERGPGMGERGGREEGRERPGPKMEKGTFLGVVTGPVSPELRDQLDLVKGMGLIIHEVAPDSPAKTAGFLVNDVITKVNDQLIINPEQLMVLIRSMKPDQAVEITLYRKAKEIKVTVKLAEKLMPSMDGPMGMGGPMGHMGPMGRMGPGEGCPMMDRMHGGMKDMGPGGPRKGPGDDADDDDDDDDRGPRGGGRRDHRGNENHAGHGPGPGGPGGPGEGRGPGPGGPPRGEDRGPGPGPGGAGPRSDAGGPGAKPNV